jgi:hypothetical protein
MGVRLSCSDPRTDSAGKEGMVGGFIQPAVIDVGVITMHLCGAGNSDQPVLMLRSMCRLTVAATAR